MRFFEVLMLRWGSTSSTAQFMFAAIDARAISKVLLREEIGEEDEYIAARRRENRR
jgi:hypothetical protein